MRATSRRAGGHCPRRSGKGRGREGRGRRADREGQARLRGVSHEYAFFVSLVLGIGLILLAQGGEARLAVAIYAASLSALFGVSALYHRVDWQRPEARRWMRRLDHTMIFFLIAGTVTPFALLVMDGPLATALLIAVWSGALAGTSSSWSGSTTRSGWPRWSTSRSG